MSILRDLIEQDKKTSIDLEKNNEIIIKNDTDINEVNKTSTFCKQFENFTSNFEALDSLIVDDNVQYYYKQWHIQVFEAENDAEMNRMIDLIGANLSYNIIYNESVENALDYYNLGSELQETSYFTIEDKILFFNVSLYIEKVWDGADITNPQVKLDITLTPFFYVKD